MLVFAFPDWDRELFILLNSKHTPWIDPIMFFLSSYTVWITICVLIMGYMVYQNRTIGQIAALFIFISVGLNFLINRIVKLFIMRPRPGSDPLIQDITWQLETIGASSSFFSGHASCSFSLAIFSVLYFKNRYYNIAIFIWAFIVSYSRIYVGKHYPLDILVGIAFGLLTGYIAFQLYKLYYKKHKI